MIPKPESKPSQHWFVVIAIAVVAVFCHDVPLAQDEEAELRDAAAAVSVVEQLLEKFVAAAQLPDLEARFAFLREPVVTSHDLDYIGELTVRRQWRDWSSEQRDLFLTAFRTLSVMNYAARFGNVSDDSFAILGQEPAGNARVQVHTTIARADRTPIPLDFVLQAADDGRWRIANVFADGVSDLALRRAEYRGILIDAGFEGLVAELEAQTRELVESTDD